MARTVAVAGATGHTGARVLRALDHAGATLRLIGRDAGRLARAAEPFPGASRRSITAWDETGLARALEGCRAVISCAGPFVRAGWPVARAAILARVPYCDSSGEQSFIRRVFEELDAPARESGIALVPAAGFDYLLGDLGCAIAAEGLERLDAVEITYAVAHGGLSEGTRRTLIESLGSPAYVLAEGRLRRIRIGADTRQVETPFGNVRCMLIPAGEAIMVPRHIDVQNVRTFAGSRGLPASPALLQLLSAVGRFAPARRVIERVFARTGPGIQPDADTRFLVRATARSWDGRTRAVTLRAEDPYDFTARSLTGLALQLADLPVTGVLAPAHVVPAREFLERLGVDIDA